MEPHAFLALLGRLAPLQLAETWDNVGVLVEPLAERPVQRVLLTIDLTERVLTEAEEARCDCVVAYHPPLFSGIKRLAASDPAGRLVLKIVRSEMLIYSPHTALDAMSGGVNDWLAAAFEWSTCRPLRPSAAAGVTTPGVGQGRFLELETPLSLDAAVARVKAHLSMDLVRVANGTRMIRSVALCAGAGGSVLAGVRADLYLTGEMRHHDVLSAVAAQTSVILTEHSNSERGYLPTLRAALLRETAGAIEVFQSQSDADPLHTA